MISVTTTQTCSAPEALVLAEEIIDRATEDEIGDCTESRLSALLVPSISDNVIAVGPPGHIWSSEFKDYRCLETFHLDRKHSEYKKNLWVSSVMNLIGQHPSTEIRVILRGFKMRDEEAISLIGICFPDARCRISSSREIEIVFKSFVLK